MTKRAILYGRVSGDDKARTGGENLKAQIDLCREYATKEGYNVIAELAEDDRGASGATFDLPQLAKALELARSGAFDVLIARELDRLSRDLAKQLIVEQELRRSGVVIEYALYDFPDTPEGRLNKNLRAMLAEYEREKIAQRMMRGKQRSVRAGNVLLSKPAFGYTVGELDGLKTLIPSDEEAPVVRQVFEWYTRRVDPLSTRQIARELGQLGILSPSGSNTWHPASVQAMLKNHVYAGEWAWGHGKDAITVEVTPLISEELFEAAQLRRKENTSRRTPRTENEYLLSGRVSCPYCGYAFVGILVKPRKGRRNAYAYYTHAPESDIQWQPGCYRTFRVKHVDDAVWGWVTTLFLDEGALEEALHTTRAQRESVLLPKRQELQTVDELIEKHKKELMRLLDLYLSGNFPQELLTEKKTALEVTLNSLEDRRADLQAQLAEQELSTQQIENIMRLRLEVRKGILAAKDNFKLRRELIEFLDVRGELYKEGDKRWINASCIVDSAVISYDKSNWIASPMKPLSLSITRPRALITPVVSVCSRPKGLPIAKTNCPTSSVLELARGIGAGKSSPASMRMTARSFFESVPTTSAA